MNPVLDAQPLGSFAVRYQNAVLRWALAGLLVLVLAYGLGWWLQGQGWATAQFPATVLWCVIPYAVATQWLYQGAYLPHFERVSYVLVATTMPFALTPLGFALAQHPYSRGAVLLAYGLTAAWFLLGYRAIRRRDVLHLACLDAALPGKLQARIGSPRLEALPLVLHVCQAGQFPTPCDGVVLDPASPGWAGRVRAASHWAWCMLRSFHSRNGRPCRPVRCCENSAGPGESSLTARAVSRHSGSHSGSVSTVAPRSSMRLATS